MGSLSEITQNAVTAIQAARGFETTFAGLTITFSALGLISFCISQFPRALGILNKFYPEKSAHGVAKPKTGMPEDVVAAIGLAYHSLKNSGK